MSNLNEDDHHNKTTKPILYNVSLNKAIEELAEDVATLWCPASASASASAHGNNVPVQRLEAEPTPLEFMREYVSRSVPCIIPYQGPGVGLTLDDLVSIAEEEGDDVCMITVDVTPDGYGDCVRPVIVDIDEKKKKKKEDEDNEIVVDMFVEPEQRKMSISEFCQNLRNSKKNRACAGCWEHSQSDLKPISLLNESVSNDKQNTYNLRNAKEASSVYYYSKQNNCLRTELKEIYSRNIFPVSIPFAEEAFGASCHLEAVNLWIGDESSVSSMHRDYYENLFVVLSGEKVFTLCPPPDALNIPEEDFLAARFRKEKNIITDIDDWVVEAVLETGENGDNKKQAQVKWIKPDITCKKYDENKYPLLKYTHPIEVKVRAGEILYLPSLWLHRVTQTCETVGVNFWYDMRFDDPKWCFFHFIQNIRNQIEA